MSTLFNDPLISLHMSLTICLRSSTFPTNIGGKVCNSEVYFGVGLAIVNSPVRESSIMYRVLPARFTSMYSNDPDGTRPFRSHFDLQRPVGGI